MKKYNGQKCTKILAGFILLFLLFAAKIFCDEELSEEKPWHLLESAKIKMEQGEFGEALSLANSAREIHKKQSREKYDFLFKALKPKEVKRQGDDIYSVYSILKKRENYDACKILDDIFITHPPVFFDKSISALMEWLDKRDAFPESDFLAGQIHFAEGEFSQAMHYYKLAWDYRLFLNVPDERFKIIYAMANTSKLLQKYDDQEKYLLLVLTEDPVYGTTNLESPTLQAMINTITKETDVEKFFLLYRHKNQIALQAYLELTEIYMQTANYRRALTVAALGSIIVVTNLDEAIAKTDYTHKYTDFPALLSGLRRKNEILSWAENKHFWRCLLNLADCLQASGDKKQALDLYQKLARYLPSIKYAQEAAYKENKLNENISSPEAL